MSKARSDHSVFLYLSSERGISDQPSEALNTILWGKKKQSFQYIQEIETSQELRSLKQQQQQWVPQEYNAIVSSHDHCFTFKH